MAERNDIPAFQIVPQANHVVVKKEEPSEEKIPRPPNAWILFRADIFRSMNSGNNSGNMSQSAVSKVISKLWNSLDGPTKQHYERLAEIKKMEHALKYPDYRYTPKSKEQKEREKKQKRLDKAAATASQKTRRRPAARANGANCLAATICTTTASTPSVSSISTGGPTPPLSVNNSPSPATSDDAALTYPFSDPVTASADNRRAISRRTRQIVPYTRSTTVRHVQHPTAPNSSSAGAVGIYSQDSHIYAVNPAASQAATKWASEQGTRLPAYPITGFYQPAVAVSPRFGEAQVADAPSFEVEMGNFKSYTSWMVDPNQPAQYDWKEYHATSVDPGSLLCNVGPSGGVHYTSTGFYAQPVSSASATIVPPPPPVEDEMLNWFDFNGFGNQAPGEVSGESQNIEVMQWNEREWNAYPYLQH